MRPYPARKRKRARDDECAGEPSAARKRKRKGLKANSTRKAAGTSAADDDIDVARKVPEKSKVPKHKTPEATRTPTTDDGIDDARELSKSRRSAKGTRSHGVEDEDSDYDAACDTAGSADAQDTVNAITMTRTPADREFAKTHQIGVPPDIRSRGPFSDDEASIIRSVLRAFRDENGLDTNELVDMIQYTAQQHHSKTSVEKRKEHNSRRLWYSIYDRYTDEFNGKRSTTSLKSFVRQRYTILKRAGWWTKEEDDLLEELHAKYSNKWTKISTLIGTRSAGDCRDRWRNYVAHRDTRKINVWSEEEVERLHNAVEDVIRKDAQKCAQEGNSPLSEYTPADIQWSAVSEEMGYTRNRLQCRQKWVQLRQQDGHEKPARRRRKSRNKAHLETPLLDTKSDGTPEATPEPPMILFGDAAYLFQRLLDYFRSNDLEDEGITSERIDWRHIGRGSQWSADYLERAFCTMVGPAADDPHLCFQKIESLAATFAAGKEEDKMQFSGGWLEMD